jgi:hypothetical protein
VEYVAHSGNVGSEGCGRHWHGRLVHLDSQHRLSGVEVLVMIAKNELMETLAAVQAVATERGADVGTVLTAVVIGVLDEMNNALQAIGAQLDARNELQQTQLRQMLSIMKQVAGEQGISLDLDEVEIPGKRLLRDQVSDLHDDPVGVLGKMVECNNRLQAVENRGDAQEERLEAHHNELHGINQRLDHIGELVTRLLPPAGDSPA